MNSGRLRERVQIQQNKGARGTTGQKAENWTTIATRWCAASFNSGDEREDGDVPSYRAKWRFEFVAAIAGLSIKHRILWKSRAYAIKSIDDSRPDRIYVFADEGTHADT